MKVKKELRHGKNSTYRGSTGSVNELLSIAQRFAVAKMLKEDNTYLEVAEKTGASTATISRVNRSLNYGKDGYELVFSRMKSFQQNDKQSNEKTDK